MKNIAFVDFWSDFHPETSQLVRHIREVVDIQITDMSHADYVFYSVHGDQHWQSPDRCVKIFFTGEDVSPDFNACDYAISFEWLQYEDRHLRLPLYYLYPGICERVEQRHLQHFEQIRQQKTGFCSMTVSNKNRHPIFVRLFEELSKYKRIDSGGMWRNNIGGRVEDKFAFDSTHKFSIVCENTAHSGYTTEKLVQALAANCIPIYWGDPNVSKVFNPKAIINVSDFPTLADVVEQVKHVDRDEQLWHDMLAVSLLTDDNYRSECQEEALRQFLSNIFSQPLEKAYRRNRLMWGRLYIDDRVRQTRSIDFRLWKGYHKWVWNLKKHLFRR